MADRWYYTHGGQTFGPITAAGLMELVGLGRLGPADLIWPEGKDRAQAVEARVALDLVTPSRPAKPAPDWLKDLRAEEEAPAAPAVPAVPDWLEDVRQAEQVAPAPPEPSEPRPSGSGAAPAGAEVPAQPAEPPAATPRPPAVRPLHLVIGSNTTRGLVRDTNEDSLLLRRGTWGSGGESQEVALVVVADGMGGHRGGGRASRIVTGALAGVLPALLNAGTAGPAELAAALDAGLREANRLIREAASQDAACKDMGSTAVALLVWGRRACISLVGDCRVYHWRAGHLAQVTRDQTLVARMVELGQLTPEEAARHPRRNEVSQALGKSHLLEPARYELALEAGDWLITCSDGLPAHVEDRVICGAINENRQSPFALANRLIALAEQGGGSDNCTVVAVSCS
jgi:serine/threonine protein phosphatase PrpC